MPVHSIAESALAAAFGYGSLASIGWFYLKFRGQEGMGMGDYKMAAMIGAFLGLMPMLFALMIGSVLGAVGGLIAIAFTKEKAATYEVPFGSFMGIAAMAVAWMEAARGMADAVVH
jgi:leader peptidase (prepilin peptidase)/N-methyltransferase